MDVSLHNVIEMDCSGTFHTAGPVFEVERGDLNCMNIAEAVARDCLMTRQLSRWCLVAVAMTIYLLGSSIMLNTWAGMQSDAKSLYNSLKFTPCHSCL
jgi:hypothetical protein